MVAIKNIVSTALLSSVVFADEAPANHDNKKKSIARAHLDRGLVKGIIEFTSTDGVVDIHFDVTGLPPNVGPFLYKIHENRVVDQASCAGAGEVFNPYNSHYQTCDDLDNDAMCALGDLSGKHGYINTTCFETKYLDQYLSLNSHNPAYVVGKSLVITDPNNNIISCGNIEAKSKKSRRYLKRDVQYPGLYNELVLEEKKVVYTNTTSNSTSFDLGNDESSEDEIATTSTYSSGSNSIYTSGGFAAIVVGLASLL